MCLCGVMGGWWVVDGGWQVAGAWWVPGGGWMVVVASSNPFPLRAQERSSAGSVCEGMGLIRPNPHALNSTDRTEAKFVRGWGSPPHITRYVMAWS